MSDDKVRLFHLTSPSAVDYILKEGIKTSQTQCMLPLEQVQPRERDKAVFAYDEKTLRRIAKYGRPDDKVIVFEVDPNEVLVGELHAECTPHYKKTVVEFKDYPYQFWEEPEFFISRLIKPQEIVEVKNKRDFLAPPSDSRA